MDTITTPGIYVAGTLVARKPERNGYCDIYVSTDPAFAPQRFSVRVGGDVELHLDALQLGDSVLLRVAAPRVGRSKTGNPYLAGFYILGLADVE